MTRALSPAELDEIDNLAAECDLAPERLRVYFAELIRLREFSAVARRYQARLPRMVRDSYQRTVPPKRDVPHLVDEALERSIDADLQPGMTERLL